jgi:uncharacterized damage-inducible protein DinB
LSIDHDSEFQVSNLIPDLTNEFRRHKHLADGAIANLSDADFVRRPAEQVNPIALIVKHLAGNLASRWSDFLTTDGDKPTRERDAEFIVEANDTRTSLVAAWETRWSVLFETLAKLTDSDLTKSVTIRGEPHSVQQALLRGLDHAAYHIGQILYVARWLNPDGRWLTIAPGHSRDHEPGYLKQPDTH